MLVLCLASISSCTRGWGSWGQFQLLESQSMEESIRWAAGQAGRRNPPRLGLLSTGFQSKRQVFYAASVQVANSASTHPHRISHLRKSGIFKTPCIKSHAWLLKFGCKDSSNRQHEECSNGQSVISIECFFFLTNFILFCEKIGELCFFLV
jgi:hypothetical protein